MHRRLKYFLLSAFSGALLAVAWPPNCIPFLLFLAFIPLLYLETNFSEKGRGKWFWLYAYFGLFIFNILSTWWVWNASPGGAVFMLFANTLLMTLPFVFYRFAKRMLGQSKGLIGLILAWLTFEYFHFRWDLNYPWLTLGNAFATAPKLVQWYEYTGALGGSFWILAINALIFTCATQFRKRIAVGLTVLLIAPAIWSVYLKNTQNSGCNRAEILIIQPNIDPYEKFEAGKENGHLQTFINLCEEGITPNTKLIVFPETALVGNINEKVLPRSYAIRLLRDFQQKHEGVSFLGRGFNASIL